MKLLSLCDSSNSLSRNDQNIKLQIHRSTDPPIYNPPIYRFTNQDVQSHRSTETSICRSTDLRIDIGYSRKLSIIVYRLATYGITALKSWNLSLPR